MPDETHEDPAVDAAGDTPDDEGASVEPQDADPRDAEIADLRDRLARALADYDNLIKRHERDALLERERVKARVVEHFLQVYEYGKMAEQEAERHPGALAEGVKMIVREFDRMLESEGVQAFGAVGDAFDARRHEAVGEEAAEGVAPGRVSRVVKQGYMLGARVLHYAKVMVAPGPGVHEDEESSGPGR